MKIKEGMLVGLLAHEGKKKVLCHIGLVLRKGHHPEHWVVSFPEGEFVEPEGLLRPLHQIPPKQIEAFANKLERIAKEIKKIEKTKQ